MKYGLLMFPTQHPVDVSVVARQAEALGFDSLWVGSIRSCRCTVPRLSLAP
jgi:alkanesulfonate monooxygenase SsuD/methylene tetrahydromethanopterin reductase-like flavin-dependent oxidoreductase (luciferase family)